MYAVGDRGPAGGFVFYDKGDYSDGWRYLEAAAEDMSKPEKWGEYLVTEATDSGFGEGSDNTEKIVEVMGEKDNAAKLCADYRGGNMKDWYLPSIDELCELFKFFREKNINGLDGTWYWSSTEYSEYSAWFINTVSGKKSNGSDSNGTSKKSDHQSVRAIRAF